MRTAVAMLRPFTLTNKTDSSVAADLTREDMSKLVEAVRLAAQLTRENDAAPHDLNRIGRALSTVAKFRWQDE